MALEVMARAAGPIPLDAGFRVEPGELLALVGHSGSGKTTLLRTIAGLWRPEDARVSVAGTPWLDTARGVNLPPHRRRVGMVFQNYALFPHMTALHNVMAAMDVADRAEAARLLELVNLHGLAGRRPAQLSGGQQQRVAIARALANAPDLLLADEPTGALDTATGQEVLALFDELNSQGLTLCIVTHDNEVAARARRRIAFRDGLIVSDDRNVS